MELVAAAAAQSRLTRGVRDLAGCRRAAACKALSCPVDGAEKSVRTCTLAETLSKIETLTEVESCGHISSLKSHTADTDPFFKNHGRGASGTVLAVGVGNLAAGWCAGTGDVHGVVRGGLKSAAVAPAASAAGLRAVAKMVPDHA